MQPPLSATASRMPLDPFYTRAEQVKITKAMIIGGVALIALGILALLATTVWGVPLMTTSIVAITVTDLMTTTALTAMGKLMMGGVFAVLTGTCLTFLGAQLTPKISNIS